MAKRTLDQIGEILASADKYLSSVSISLFKEIVTVDLEMDRGFINAYVKDRRRVADWYKAAKQAYLIKQAVASAIAEMKSELGGN